MENDDSLCFNKVIQKKFRMEILDWGTRNSRDFPWRRTCDIYRILIAEIFLHRTKADQVREIYETFITKYPDFRSMLNAPKIVIIEELRSLGLSWRTNLLYELSEVVVNDFGGDIPLQKETLMTLPGVGKYIASAVICFGLNKPEPVLDTNTVRILGRVCGIEISDSSRRSKKFEDLMRGFIGDEVPRIISFFMIDLGAKMCLPKHPGCEICPINDICNFAIKKRSVLNA